MVTKFDFGLFWVSIDRLWSVTWSIHYRNNNSGRKSLLVIFVTWIYVNVMWLPAFIYDRKHNLDGVGECAWEPTQNLHSVSCGHLDVDFSILILVFF